MRWCGALRGRLKNNRMAIEETESRSLRCLVLAGLGTKQTGSRYPPGGAGTITIFLEGSENIQLPSAVTPIKRALVRPGGRRPSWRRAGCCSSSTTGWSSTGSARAITGSSASWRSGFLTCSFFGLATISAFFSVLTRGAAGSSGPSEGGGGSARRTSGATARAVGTAATSFR